MKPTISDRDPKLSSSIGNEAFPRARTEVVTDNRLTALHRSLPRVFFKPKCKGFSRTSKIFKLIIQVFR